MRSTFICNFSEYEKLINKSKVMQNDEYILAYVLDPNKEKGYRLEKLSIDKNIITVIQKQYLLIAFMERFFQLFLKNLLLL